MTRGACRSEIFVRQPLGDGVSAVLLRRDVPPAVVPDIVAVALETLRRLVPIEAHLHAIDAVVADGRLRELARTIVAATELVYVADARAAGRSACAGERAPEIRTIGVLTCERPDALEACIDSFVQNAALDVVVVDDSPTPRARAVNVERLERLARVRGCVLRYAGYAEKHAYARRLAATASVDLATIEFALFGCAEVAGSIGANRNALLLACVGEAFLSTDDDTLARIARPERVDSTAVRLAEAGDPMTYRFFPSREAAIAGCVAVDENVADIHAATLGRSLAAIVSDARVGQVDLDAAPPHSIEQLGNGSGRVAATVLGIYGDSGMFAGSGFTMNWIDHGRARGDERDYIAAVTGRELLRVAPCTVIRRSPPFMSTSIGLDHRTLLPPFMPVLRDEDGVFSATLAACFEQAHVAHLPRAILHDATPGRRYEPDRVQAAGVRRFANLAIELLRSTGFGPGSSSPEARMAVVGRYLQHLGACRDRDFMGAVRALHLRGAATRIRHLEDAMRAARDAPPAWLADARAYLTTLRAAIGREDFYVPWDLPGSAAERIAIAQRVLDRLGRLFLAWPAIVAGAHALARSGQRLGRTIAPSHAHLATSSPVVGCQMKAGAFEPIT